ncbi:MAG: hypothetical protein IKO03_05555 [Lachnospiraceae bacterium]|nr:hypothetical protein [Lachnospiraceae bacterium]MBR4606367.1 hypothetical protein [Lachnospiraceae bacterium]MBR6151719.1 hypothetical protein [Lachnospiraceae bacterium]
MYALAWRSMPQTTGNNNSVTATVVVSKTSRTDETARSSLCLEQSSWWQ